MGVLFALRFLAAFTSVSRLLPKDLTGASPSRAEEVSLLQLSRKEGMLNLVSSVLFPVVSRCYCCHCYLVEVIFVIAIVLNSL